MRNLALVSVSLTHLHLPDAFISTTAIDLDTNDIYLTSEKLTGDGEVGVEIWRCGTDGGSFDRDAFPPSLVAMFTTNANAQATSTPQVVSARCLAETHTLALVMRGGDISTLSLDDPLEVEVVGSVEAGIAAASWSPDDSLLILVTDERNLIVMTNTFEVLSEAPIDTSDSGEDQSVNVGWGSKETQFHGTLGKSAAKAAPDAIGSSPDDDARPRVSWRGDGNFFTISSISTPPSTTSSNAHQHRRLRVYDRNGALQTTSELVGGLEHTLAWRPSGNLIASTQRFGFEGGGAGREGRHDVVFFERNGLRHGEFELREKGVEGKTTAGTEGRLMYKWGYRVKELCWNSDSTVLSVWIEGSTGDYVQLWTIGNYHWYLKHEIVPPPFPSPEGAPPRLTSMSWHPEDAQRLIITTKTSIIQRTYIWETYHSRAPPPNDSGSVAVCDGGNLLLTPFRTQNVPPPMSSHQLSVSFPTSSSSTSTTSYGHVARYPIHVAFSPHTDALAVLWEYGYLQMWELRTRIGPGRGKVMDPVILCEGVVEGAGDVRQVVLFGAQTEDLRVAILSSSKNGDSVSIVRAGSDAEAGTASFTATQMKDMGGSHGRLVGSSSCPLVWQSSSGELFDLTSHLDDAPHRIAAFPQFCPFAEIAAVRSSNGTSVVSSPTHVFVGLSPSGKLHATSASLTPSSATGSSDGHVTIAMNATSFTCASGFVIFTTSVHESHFVPLSLLASILTPSAPSDVNTIDALETDALPDHGDGNGATISIDEEAAAKKVAECERRRVERGSRIVVAVPSAMVLVLQMPRGNLETIYPRPLVMEVIKKDLDNLAYGRAFNTCKKHRIDMSVLVDHDMATFMSNVKTFVDEVGIVDSLNLFLTNFARSEAHPVETTTTVCDAVRTHLEVRDLQRYVNSILTAYVVKQPSDYEGALALLLRLQATDKAIVDDAVKYIIFLVDVERLYDTALGMYDFRLVLLVAEHSQKDPREYLPFLRELRALDEHYRNFKIDDHLRRYTMALKNLHLAGVNRFDEAMAYMEKHTLYSTALQLWKESTSYNIVLDRYGQWLFERRDFREAAIVFTRGGHSRKTMVAYEKALDWRELFDVATQVGLSEEETVATAYRIAEDLVSKKRCSEAGRVLLDYAKDIKEAVRALLQSNEFSEARRLIALYKVPELLEEVVYPAAFESSAQIQEDIGEMRDQLPKQVLRLRELRQKKIEEPDTFYGTEEANLHNVDVMTDVSMPETAFTRYTAAPSKMSGTSSRRTSRSKRKMERKLGSGKKGTIDEEEYLLNSVAKVVARFATARDEAHSLMRHLLQFAAEHCQEAESLHTEVSRFEDELRSSTEEIWAKPLAQDDEPSEREGWAKRMKEKIEERANAVERIPKPALAVSDWKEGVLDVF